MLLFLRSVSSPGDLNLSRDGIFGWNWFHYGFFFFFGISISFRVLFYFLFFFFFGLIICMLIYILVTIQIFARWNFLFSARSELHDFALRIRKGFFFLCMFFGMIENLKIFFFSSFLCKLNNFFSLNFVRRWISVWEILLSLKYVYDD